MDTQNQRNEMPVPKKVKTVFVNLYLNSIFCDSLAENLK